MEAVNEVVLALCDEIIAPMRQNYPLTSSIGFSTAALSLTLNAIIPSAMVTRIGLKQLAALLLRPSSFFGKHFLGQAELSQHPVNLFFSLLLQWKFGNFSAELIKELSEPQKIHLNHTLNHVQFYLPALMVGSATGYLFGLLPTTSSAYGLGYTLLVEEASALKKASFPCNALSYTFAMGKLSYFLGSQILIGSQRSTDDSLEGLEVCLSLINQDGPARRLDFEQLINMMQHPLFNQQMLKIDASGRRQFYSAMHELIIKHQQEGQRLPPDAYANLETAFFNRYLRRDYPALLRLPIGCAYIILHPLRHLIRTGLYVLASAQDKPSVAKSNEIEAAIDRVLFDDWSGLLRRILDNFYLTTLLSLRYSVEISLGVLLVLPINLIWMAACLMGGPESLTISDPFRLTYQSTLYLFKLISSPIVWAAELFFFLTKTVQRLMGYLLHHLKEMLPLNSSIDLFNPNTQAYPSTAEAVHRAAWNTDLRSAVEQIQRALSAQASPTWPACTR